MVLHQNYLSKEYQNYSKSNRKKTLEKTFKFLSDQEKILKENSLKSMQKLIPLQYAATKI